MLIAAMVGIDAGSTMDMDAIIEGMKLSEEVLRNVINTILDCPIDDGVIMTLIGFENIREPVYQWKLFLIKQDRS